MVAAGALGIGQQSPLQSAKWHSAWWMTSRGRAPTMRERCARHAPGPCARHAPGPCAGRAVGARAMRQRTRPCAGMSVRAPCAVPVSRRPFPRARTARQERRPSSPPRRRGVASGRFAQPLRSALPMVLSMPPPPAVRRPPRQHRTGAPPPPRAPGRPDQARGRSRRPQRPSRRKLTAATAGQANPPQWLGPAETLASVRAAADRQRGWP